MHWKQMGAGMRQTCATISHGGFAQGQLPNHRVTHLMAWVRDETKSRSESIYHSPQTLWITFWKLSIYPLKCVFLPSLFFPLTLQNECQPPFHPTTPQAI